jgi:rfaE bifunctional protein kinase chain/domain
MNFANVAIVVGHFNVLHPGHIRLFKFARNLESKLVVAVESDQLAGTAAHIPEQLRLEGVKSCSLVDEAFIFYEPVTELIDRLRPATVVKGREFETRFNPEAAVIEGYGGRLLFSSGEMQFSSADLIRQEVAGQTNFQMALPTSYMERHDISVERLSGLIESFSKVRVLTVGDLIVDNYIACEPLGMSQEDPTLVVSPIDQERFIGGAGIVASHAKGLGAESRLLSVTGSDPAREFCVAELQRFGVGSHLFEDHARPTTLKERYRSYGKTLLRVSHLQQAAVALPLQRELIEKASKALKDCDLLIFADFNYGVLPQAVVDELISIARANKVRVAADSQSSSQLGDVARFKGVDLLLPTEREARVSTQNREDGLVVLAEQLRRKSNAQHILLKLAADGVLVHSPDSSANGWLTDQVEALNKSPTDVAGAGDSMLVASALTLAAGGSIWEAACLGSIAAAIQVARVGNVPLCLAALKHSIDHARKL